jgi:hypothetical protein
MNREQVFKNLRPYSQYKVVVIDHRQRTVLNREFSELRDAVAYIYPSCKTEYDKEFFVMADTSKGQKFLQFKPFNP